MNDSNDSLFLYRLDTICGLVGLRFRVHHLPPTMGNIGEIKLADLDAFEAVFQNEGATKISHIVDVTAVSQSNEYNYYTLTQATRIFFYN